MSEDGHKYFFGQMPEMPYKRKENKMKNYWYNFRVGKYEALEETPTNFEDYIPVDGVNLYNLYVQRMGIEPIEACKLVLQIIVGNKDER